MSRFVVVLAAISSIFVAAPAFAATGFSAALEKPLAQPHDTIIEGVAWRCDGSQCVSASDTDTVSAKASCRQLAREVGAFASFNSDGKPLPPDQLTKCNASAPSAK